MSDLHKVQTTAGAEFADIEGKVIALSFGNDAPAAVAARQSVAVCDRSHWGCLQLTGADRIRYLHNQSTNDFYSLQPGQSCDTIFVTSTARTIDLVTAYILEDQVLLIVSPNRRQRLLEWLDRYIFPADQVFLKDVTADLALFSLLGPESTPTLAKLGGSSEEPENGYHCLMQLAGIEVRVSHRTELALPGYTLIVQQANAAKLWQALLEAGVVPLGEQVWEQLRIEQGRPKPDQELTEDYNPLEAGLWQAVSFSKGCYIGQETIPRLNTYKGVKQELWGVRLDHAAAPGSVITLGEEKVGKLTSITETPTGPVGLAYIRTKVGGAGLVVQIGESAGEVIDVPFLSRGYVE